MNPPITKEPSVYRTDIFRIIEPEIEGNYYPEFSVRKRESFMFPSLEESMEFIKSGEIAKYDEEPIYCIHVYELPVGKDIVYTCCKREWVFDGEGNLMEKSVCSSLTEDLDSPEGHFYGRAKDSIRFKPGDIVEVHDMENMEVRLAIVLALCNDIESCWMEYQKVIENCKEEGLSEENADDNYWLYACDDCYYVGYGSEPEYGTSHPCTTDVFTPRFPIPDNLKACLNRVKTSIG